jgi:glucose/arabinose dehydrogenase
VIGRTARLAGIALATGTVACAQRPSGPAPRSPTPEAKRGALAIDTITTGLVHPWAVALLPDGRFLVTERPGRMRLIGADGRIGAPLAGVPPVYARGQGGLLDVALDPEFAANHRVFFSFAEPGPAGTAGTAVGRARLTDEGLADLAIIYRQEPKVAGGGHFGSRLVFARDGNLFITQGERFDYRDRAQDLSVLLGKIVRVTPDGAIPPDNPFINRSGARPEIWSYGHRNVQAAALDPATGQLWTVEHGAAGGDELNHPEAGKNYGWPVITYGRDYNGRSIGEGAVKEGMEQPVYYWDPVIAPSGMTFYTGAAFPEWKGSVLIGGLASQVLVRLVLEHGRVTREERFLGELHQRVRDVREGPDGFLYIVTDEDPGSLLRLRPR